MLGAVNKDTITRGLRYSIATGNWGMQGQTGIRPGVSQVDEPHFPRNFMDVHAQGLFGGHPWASEGLLSTCSHKSALLAICPSTNVHAHALFL